MPITPEQLQSIIAKSQHITKKVDEISPVQQTGQMNEGFIDMPPMQNYNPMGNLNYVDTSNALNGLSSFDSDTEYEKPEALVKQQMAQRKSKMPAAIRESLINNPIGMNSTNVLDQLTEQAPARNVNVPNQGNLKELIKECIKEAMTDNDNSLRTIQLNGGKIRLVDNSGRVFVANLEYKGNISDSKKKK